jgi:hypothetical protein
LGASLAAAIEALPRALHGRIAARAGAVAVEQRVDHALDVDGLSVLERINEDRFLGRGIGVEILEDSFDDADRIGRPGDDDGVGSFIG